MSFLIKTAYEQEFLQNVVAREVWKCLAESKIDLLPTEDEKMKFRNFRDSDFLAPFKFLCSGSKDTLQRRLTVYFDLEVEEAPPSWNYDS